MKPKKKEKKFWKQKFIPNPDQFEILLCETKNAAILDSGCSRTVAGTAWKNTYLDSLSDKKRLSVTQNAGGSVFVFGGGLKFTSYGSVLAYF